MKPYNVEIFTPEFDLVGNTNIHEFTYKEDYLAGDENSVTIFPVDGVRKQDYIRISRGKEEYTGIITEIVYGTEKSKELQTISYKPFTEILSTSYLFDVDKQEQGTFEDFIADAIRELFLENEDSLQNVQGLSVETTSATYDWYLHITPSDSGGHYNIVNLLSSVIIPALEKYRILVKPILDVQGKRLVFSIGVSGSDRIIIESDLPNILQKNVVIRQVNNEVNKLVLYDAGSGYTDKITYYLHNDLSYDRKDSDRVLPVSCSIRAITTEEGTSFESAAQKEAAGVFGNLSYSNLIELLMENEDELVHPKEMPFGQRVEVISGKVSYTTILTGREIGKTTKLIFGTVRLDLTKILRRNANG